MSATTSQQPLRTNQDLAEIMSWSVATVHQRRYRGASLPRSIKVDGTIRYRQEDIDAWLEEHTTSTTVESTDDAGFTISN